MVSNVGFIEQRIRVRVQEACQHLEQQVVETAVAKQRLVGGVP